MERFIGKVAIVTGSSSGIGESISIELVKRGLVVVGLARRIEKLQKLAQEVNSKSYSGKFHPLKCDIANEDEIQKTFLYISETIGAPSILVNNAGTLVEKQLEDTTGTDFDTIFGTNAKGLLLAAKEAIKLMNENSIAGHILNINSLAGFYILSLPGIMLYSASKHASRIFSEILRRTNTEKKMNIKITNISPGFVKTNMAALMYENENPALDDPQTCIKCEDVANACIAVLDTPPNVLISELTIMPIHQEPS